MKKINFNIDHPFKLKNVVVLFLILCNGFLLFPFSSSSSSDVEQCNYLQIINQAINSSLETSSNKFNFNLLEDAYSQNFYSFDYYFKKLSTHPKIFIIISETYSEHNIRQSSFLITQAQTST